MPWMFAQVHALDVTNTQHTYTLSPQQRCAFNPVIRGSWMPMSRSTDGVRDYSFTCAHTRPARPCKCVYTRTYKLHPDRTELVSVGRRFASFCIWWRRCWAARVNDRSPDWMWDSVQKLQLSVCLGMYAHRLLPAHNNLIKYEIDNWIWIFAFDTQRLQNSIYVLSIQIIAIIWIIIILY